MNIKTGEVRILRFLSANDSGRVMGGLTFESQVIGGVTMGIGLAMTEARILDGNQTGRNLTGNWHDYKIPTAYDVPAGHRLPSDRHPRQRGEQHRRQGAGRARDDPHGRGRRQCRLQRHRRAGHLDADQPGHAPPGPGGKKMRRMVRRGTSWKRIRQMTSGKARKGISRRGFIKLVGAGALATTVGDAVKPGRAAAAADARGDREGRNRPDHPPRQRPAPPGQGRAPLVAPGRPPGKTGADRSETRLRPRRMRRMYRSYRRPAALRLSDPGPGGGGERDHHRRGADEGRRAGAGAAGVSGARRHAVRLLHPGPDHGGGGAPADEPEPVHRRDPPGDERQSLPLRLLRTHLQGGRGCGQD